MTAASLAFHNRAILLLRHYFYIIRRLFRFHYLLTFRPLVALLPLLFHRRADAHMPPPSFLRDISISRIWLYFFATADISPFIKEMFLLLIDISRRLG